MGFVDRGGSRESKGNSLRRSKKNPGAAAARAAGAKQAYKPPAQPEVAPALHKGTKKNPYFDCSAALLSRQFDADIDDVLDRAEQQCAGVVIWSADIDKQHQVVSMSQENSGFVYAAVGLHPDNVRGTHQREFEKWFQQVEDLSKARGCVAILSGLNLLRETATHFPQETVLRNMMATAKKNGRPLFLHCAPKHAETAERLLTLLEDYHTENGNNFPTAVVMHTFLTASNFNSQIVKKFVKLGCYFTVSAAELHSLCGGASVATAADADSGKAKEADETSAASANTPVVAGTTNTATLSRTPKQAEEDLAAFVDCLLSVLTPSHVLLASDSPWHTPQTISDDYIRSQKNEPSNFPDIIESLELAIVTFAANANKAAPGSVDEKVLLEKLKSLVNGAKETSVKVFEIPEKDVEVVAAAPAEVDAEGSTDAKKGKGKKDKHEDDQEEESHGKKGGNSKGGNKKGSRKKGKHGDNSDEEEEDDAHQNSSSKGKGGNGKGGKKKGVRVDDGSDDDEADTHHKKGGKKGKSKHDDSDDEDQSSPNKKNKGGKKNTNNKKGKHDDDEDSDDNDEKTAKSKSASKSKKNSKRANDSDESESDDSNDEKVNTETKRRTPASSDKKVSKTAAPSLSYACLKCRTKLFVPSDLIVPDDASLCSQGFFIKVVPADEQKEDEDEDEDENNKFLPSTLRVTPNTNGEIECRKCSAPKLGRCGFKLGVPGFAIRITPSKVEVVDANVSLEDLQRKALAEAERYQQEAEEAENASDSDDDGKKKKEHKKNVKANNRSNFTHFRNKNFAPKSVKLSAGIDGDDADDQNDSDSDSEPKKNEKGKRRK